MLETCRRYIDGECENSPCLFLHTEGGVINDSNDDDGECKYALPSAAHSSSIHFSGFLISAGICCTD
jgi:hypothetical protein